jgi:DNA-binding SARP family transcriptional activator
MDTAVLPPLQPTIPQIPFSNSNSTRPQLTIYCLGTFRAYEDEHPIEEWPSRKGKAIFKYLLLHRQQRITKEVLMEQFWPEATAEAARNNLNVAIYGLRQALRNGYPDFSHVLYQDDCYFLNPEMGIWVDLEQFEFIYQKACQKMQRGDTAVALPDLHAAELLYQGELLAEDRYEDWPAAQRQQLQQNYLQLLTRLCDHYFATQQYATCITFANKLLRVEPCHEVTHRLLMRAYARQQQGYLALRQYHQCVELLAEELAVPPDPVTTQLYEAIRSHKPI